MASHGNTPGSRIVPTIRPYQERDRVGVRELFIRVNRELAPAAMREQFESYILRSLAEEIDIIATYYAQHSGGFWVATAGAGGALIGMFGLERVDAQSVELRRMYVAPEVRRRGVARIMLAHAEEVARGAEYGRLVLSTSEVQHAALAFYHAAGYRLIREETAVAETNKTVGAGLRRYHFEKALD
jgi:GNAT superfamily N-acetyltransferase